MRILGLFVILFLTTAFTDCGGSGNNGLKTVPSGSSSPGPSAAPSPTPLQSITKGPLRVAGSDFIDREGRRVYLSGAIVCCDSAKDNGWPLVTRAALDDMAAHKANFTHIRMGPNTTTSEGPEFVGHLPVNDAQVDLNQWNPAYWKLVRDTIEYAAAVGIYVQVTLLDAWVLKYPQLSPFTRANNINNVDAGNCNVLKSAPQPVHERWIRKVVQETAHFDNVIYEVGNESFGCGGKLQPNWEYGVALIVRNELGNLGLSHRLIGTNSHMAEVENDPIIDYIDRHSKTVFPRGSKPIMVNEYPGAWAYQIGPDGYETKLRQAYSNGTMWQLWRGEMENPDYFEALRRLKTFREGL